MSISADPQESQGLGPVTMHSAAQAAAEMLRKAIISGALKPGERLVEQKLATRLRIGQPTLREALKELEYEGFVRKVLQKGTYVTKLEKEDYRKILEVRIPLEGLAIWLAARNLNPKAETELAMLIEEMGSATAMSDFAKFHEVDLAFHRKIWDLADNEFLTRALASICFPLFAFALFGLGPESASHRQAAVRQHDGILAGLRSHNPAEARRAFVAHTLGYWNALHDLGLKEDELAVGCLVQKGSNI